MIPEKQIADWLENPVTQAFIAGVQRRVEGFKASRADGEFLKLEADDNHRTNWLIQGGIDELEYVASIGDPDYPNGLELFDE